MRRPELERYEILEELGQGGMSVVYRARDRQLSRPVAVKVLHEFLARQPEARRRFHREAVAVAKLHHPGILEIFDYSGPDAGDAYIVTELIDGETLRSFIERRGRLRFAELAVLVVAELVRALRHAHEQSVLHRDLKPENVMITRDGGLKLMDFGLAQLMDGGTKLTATGTLLGSPAHMAPEVIDGQPSDARSDIFSTGTILYWLATGRLPFEAPNPSALFKRILDGKYEDPQVLEPKIGHGLAAIIRRTLEPRVEARYQDITELERDLLAELEAVELTPVETMARRLLADPHGFANAFEPRLVAGLVAAGRDALAGGHIARATDRFNRVLAIAPEHPEVRALVARLRRRQTLKERLQLAAVTTLAGVAVIAAGYAAVSLASIRGEDGRAATASRPGAGPARTGVPGSGATPAGAAASEARGAGGTPASPSGSGAEGTPAGAAASGAGPEAEAGATLAGAAASGAAALRQVPGGATPRAVSPELDPASPRAEVGGARGPTPTDAARTRSGARVGPDPGRDRGTAEEGGVAATSRRARLAEAPRSPVPGTAAGPPRPADRDQGRDREGPQRAPGSEGPRPAGATGGGASARPEITVRVGHGFAIAIDVDDEQRGENVMKGAYALTPGRHVVRARFLSGPQASREIEVAPTGQVFEIGPDGARRLLLDATLDFTAPTSPAQP